MTRKRRRTQGIRAVACALTLAGCMPSTSDQPESATPPASRAEPTPGPGEDQPTRTTYGHDLNSILGADGELARQDNPPPKALASQDVLHYALEPTLPPGLGASAVRREVRAAFQGWTDALANAGVPLSLEEAQPDTLPEILVGFRQPEHRDGCGAGRLSVFTDPWGTMAHTYDARDLCKPMRGAIHLNAGLTWSLNGSNRRGQFDLRTALVHEIGHLLGLPHQTDDPAGAMYEVYAGIKWLIPSHEARLVHDAMRFNR